MLIKLLILLLLFPTVCFADITPSPIPLNIQTFDGTITGYPYQILVPNNSMVVTGGVIELDYSPSGLSLPSSSTDNALVRWSGTGGKTLKDSSTTLNDNGTMSIGGTGSRVTFANGAYIDGATTNKLQVWPVKYFNVGGTPSITTIFTVVGEQGQGTDGGLYFENYSDTSSAEVFINRARGTSSLAPLAVQSGDTLGGLSLGAYSPLGWATAGDIVFNVTGTPHGTIVPTDIEFATTNEAGTYDTRATITATGNVVVYNGLSFTNSTGGVHYSTFSARNQATDINYTLPAIDGASGQVIATDGLGGLNFISTSGSQTPWTSAIDGAGYNLSGVGTATGQVVSATSALQVGSNYYTSLPTPSNIKAGTFGITIDGGGSAITTGAKSSIAIPYAGTITKVTLLGYGTGSAVIDIYKNTYNNYPPVPVNTICGSSKPTMTSTNKYQDTNLSGWTKTFSLGDVFLFNVDSATTVTGVVVILDTIKN